LLTDFVEGLATTAATAASLDTECAKGDAAAAAVLPAKAPATTALGAGTTPTIPIPRDKTGLHHAGFHQPTTKTAAALDSQGLIDIIRRELRSRRVAQETQGTQTAELTSETAEAAAAEGSSHLHHQQQQSMLAVGGSTMSLSASTSSSTSGGGGSVMGPAKDSGAHSSLMIRQAQLEKTVKALLGRMDKVSLLV
jgi:hypothetical protein